MAATKDRLILLLQLSIFFCSKSLIRSLSLVKLEAGSIEKNIWRLLQPILARHGVITYCTQHSTIATSLVSERDALPRGHLPKERTWSPMSRRDLLTDVVLLLVNRVCLRGLGGSFSF